MNNLLQEYLDFVQNRKDTFDAKVNSLCIRKDWTGLAALYIDTIVSSAYEDWDTTDLLLELDNVFEIMRNNGILMFNKPISARSKDKKDVNILVKNVIKEKFKAIQMPDGSVVKRSLGLGPAKEKHHVHEETLKIRNLPRTNAYGIPSVNILGSCYTGFYDYISPYSGTPVEVDHDMDALTFTAEKSLKLKEIFKFDDKLNEVFFEDIDELAKYGFASIAEIRINGQPTLEPAGLIRLDYDTDDTGAPYCSGFNLCLKLSPFIKGHVSGYNLFSSIEDYIANKLMNSNIVYNRETCQMRIFTNYGGKNGFLSRLSDEEERQTKIVTDRKRNIARNAEAMREYAAKEAAENARRANELLQQREEEKARLAEEREQLRQARLAQKEAKAQAKEQARADREQLRLEKEQIKHKEIINSIVNSILGELNDAGIEPTVDYINSLRADVLSDSNDEQQVYVLEALDELINMIA